MTAPRAPRALFQLSVVSIGAGILLGLGVLVLLQQAGTVYPTLLVTIVAVVLGALWGVAVPSVGRTLGARRARR